MADASLFVPALIFLILILLILGVSGLAHYRHILARLRDSEAKFRSLVGNIPGVSYRCLPDKNWTMLYISDAVEDYTGYPAQDFMLAQGGRSFSDFIHPDDAGRVSAEVLASSKTFSIEYRLIHRDGHILHLWENGNLIRNSRGEIKWLDGVILDITQRHDIEQALRQEKIKAEQAVAAKTAFLANVSHEIRTPMNAINGFTEVLLHSELTTEQQQHLNTIHMATDSLLHLLNDILDAAKLEKGLIELNSNNFSLAQTLQQVMATMRASAEKKGIVLHLEYDPGLSEFFRGDEQRLRQIILNIVGNAVKFTHQGEVIIVVTHNNNLVEISVRDTGIGISADRLETIFAPFTQADASMARRYGGTGLGTTISKQLVELMGGEISVKSEPGVGSVFIVRLPLLTGEVTQAAPLQSALALQSLRILVVDDVLPNVQLLDILLRKGGHQIVTATNGAEALALFTQERFDVVLMDVQMPVMDGLEASRQIRAHEAVRVLKPTPIIALTASVLEEDRIAATQAGMDGFATKPINLRALYAEIARLLGIVVIDERAGSDSNNQQGVTRNETWKSLTDLPTLSLIDLSSGLSNWQQESSYHSALQHFAVEYADLTQRLTTLYQQADNSALEQLLHQVKGAAANLALFPLVKLLTNLMHISKKADKADWLQQLDQLTELMVSTLAEIASLPGCSAGSSALVTPRLMPEQPDHPLREETIKAIENLRRALSVHQIDDSALHTIRTTTKMSEQALLVRKIDFAIADFEFPTAIEYLALLEEHLATEED